MSPVLDISFKHRYLKRSHLTEPYGSRINWRKDVFFRKKSPKIDLLDKPEDVKKKT